jgi:hypothetical protein
MYSSSLPSASQPAPVLVPACNETVAVQWRPTFHFNTTTGLLDLNQKELAIKEGRYMAARPEATGGKTFSHGEKR